jgi:hypothetical protein
LLATLQGPDEAVKHCLDLMKEASKLRCRSSLESKLLNQEKVVLKLHCRS